MRVTPSSAIASMLGVPICFEPCDETSLKPRSSDTMKTMCGCAASSVVPSECGVAPAASPAATTRHAATRGGSVLAMMTLNKLDTGTPYRSLHTHTPYQRTAHTVQVYTGGAKAYTERASILASPKKSLNSKGNPSKWAAIDYDRSGRWSHTIASTYFSLVNARATVSNAH
eukprot:5254485-Prymnesium_polylepis.2